MSWERDPLWAKARLFFERAFNELHDDSLFGFWCSLGLELLARAAVASVSPTLLAEPDDEHKNLLHALNRGADGTQRKSIGTARVLGLCRTLFKSEFTKEDHTLAMALVNRRNDELHTGGAPFDEFPSRQWLKGFYHACRSLANVMEESLESLFGEEEGAAATEILNEAQSEVTQRVQSAIAAHRKVFQTKAQNVREAMAIEAETEGERLSYARHHRVACPACGCVATVTGEVFGSEHISHEESSIVGRQSVSPQSFACLGCGLALEGYSELEAAQLGGHYTRTTEYSPEEYYGLVDPDDIDPSGYIEEYLKSCREEEYDNE
jgi:hypothetical protein